MLSTEEPQLPPPLPKPYPGFWQALGLFAVYLGGTIAVIVPFAVIDQMAKTTMLKSPWVLGASTLAVGLLAILVAQWAGRRVARTRGTFSDPCGGGRPDGFCDCRPIDSHYDGALLAAETVSEVMPKETYGLDKTLVGAPSR